MRYDTAAALLIAALALPATLNAQSLRAQCAPVERPNYRTFCEFVADAAVIMQPHLGIAVTGGNPVPGSASTLGMRIGKLPRISIGPRVTAAELDLPPAERVTSAAEIEFGVGSISADASIGLFQGFNLAPTIGGFASVDLLASIGTLPLPRGEGFDDSSPITWAVGARVGIMREAFTAPGVSLSVMYRQLGTFTYGSENFTDRDAFLQFTDYKLWSLRATVGKRLLGVGVTAGAGYDSYAAGVFAVVRDPALLEPFEPTRRHQLRDTDMTSSRASLFANASYTFLIVSIVAELGWHQGGDAIEGASDKLEKSALFGGVALRFGI